MNFPKTYTFKAIFTVEHDGAYSVRFPMLDGCYTQGSDYEDAHRIPAEGAAAMFTADSGMGRLFEYQDEVTNTVLNQKLYDEWGERTTLHTTCRRVTLALKDMGILENETRFRYRLNKQTITNPAVVNFILSIAMRIEDSGYYPFVSLTEFDMMFPFKYQVTKEQLMECNKFSMSNFGGELSISLND